MWVLALAGLILLILDAVRRRKRHRLRGGRVRCAKPVQAAAKPVYAFATKVRARGQVVADLVGIDSCPDGWAVATSDTSLSSITFTVVKDLAAAVGPAVDAGAFIAIDIPIGLPERGSRACDRAAREVLGPKQGSRVFPVPARVTLAGASFKECCDLNFRASDRMISKQTYAIIPKINEVDQWMTPEMQMRVREVHPEVTFCVVNGTPLLHSKKTADGQQERLAILRRHGIVFDPVQERRRLSGSRVGVDDLIDAAVALLTARRTSTGSAQVLGDGARDARGLLMEIVA